MYGLFLYTYDYYEWEYLVCVSENKKDLFNHYLDKSSGTSLPIICDELNHNDFADDEIHHYMIKEVKVV